MGNDGREDPAHFPRAGSQRDDGMEIRVGRLDLCDLDQSEEALQSLARLCSGDWVLKNERAERYNVPRPIDCFPGTRLPFQYNRFVFNKSVH